MFNLEFDFSGLGEISMRPYEGERPFFCDLRPDLFHISQSAEAYRGYKNIILIGNGGAVNSFLVLHRSLYRGAKQVAIINSMEPDLIGETRKKYGKDDTLVITASTSGTNVGALEIMSRFLDYQMVAITAENDGALRQIAEKRGIPVLFVPHITDRYLTSGALAYFPLAVLGLDIRKIDAALQRAYEKYSAEGNDALRLSIALNDLEAKGYTEVFLPIYSHRLEGFEIYITQLMHESVCKDGKGQNFLVVPAPESQHHTNQRLFGGRRNACALFLSAGQDDNESVTSFPGELDDIRLRDGTLGDINHKCLARAFDAELQGTFKNAVDEKIPAARLRLEKIDEESVTELIAFWQYTAVYSSWLRGVNPFDQPQVEKSKDISFSMRRDDK